MPRAGGCWAVWNARSTGCLHADALLHPPSCSPPQVRGDRFWSELDLVASNVLCLSAGAQCSGLLGQRAGAG